MTDSAGINKSSYSPVLVDALVVVDAIDHSVVFDEAFATDITSKYTYR